MIDVKVENGEATISASGSIEVLLADTITIVKAIHEAVIEQDEKLGETYKNLIQEDIRLAFMSEKELETEKKELEKSVLNLFSDLFGAKKEKSNEEIIREVLEGGIDENV